MYHVVYSEISNKDQYRTKLQLTTAKDTNIENEFLARKVFISNLVGGGVCGTMIIGDGIS